MDPDEAAKAFREFVSIVKALRTPETGCPWDLEQDHHSLRPYLIEEAYEVLDAIDRGQDDALRDELGDLLLQVVLHAQLADDRSAFSIAEVVQAIAAKMVRRHPHVFGSVQVSGSAEVRRNWEQIKSAEKQEEAGAPVALARVPEGLPALLRAQRIGEKVSQVQGDTASAAEMLDRVRAEFERLAAAIQGAGEGRARLEQELGEVLYSLCQLARRLGLSAEDSLRACTRRVVDQSGGQ